MVLASRIDWQTGAVVNQTPMELVSAEQNMNVNAATVVLSDNDSVSRTSNRLEGLLAPAKKKDMGWPTTSTEKAPYEGLSKRTRFCTIC